MYRFPENIEKTEKKILKICIFLPNWFLKTLTSVLGKFSYKLFHACQWQSVDIFFSVIFKTLPLALAS
jgi:hypothetical protein